MAHQSAKPKEGIKIEFHPSPGCAKTDNTAEIELL